MATYGGRRGPNVSQYLRHLNTIPAETTADDGFMDDDLDVFTNTQFFDFESGQTTDFQPPPVKPDAEQVSRTTAEDAAPIADIGGLDFISDFNFPEYPPYQATSLPAGYSDGISLHPLQPSVSGYSPPISQPPQQHPQQHSQPHPQQHPQQRPQQHPQQHAPFAQRPSPTGEKRKSDAITGSSEMGYEDQAARIAAEEDKRRRNTAASARFRIKKKQREQALEQSAKDMTDKVTTLEARIQQLETENKWLKNMILEKNGGSEKIASTLEKGSTFVDGKDGAKVVEASRAQQS
ncbi:related to regulatory protein cys-3 [Cephalotrichum gorgonifer]|uniref:Related to regulatory protein cys-3 n=1 Tax=Cephalotrichum gorgonifer TaxID=2041049 RepID=A0AAE8MUU7_9PEZI|nr:related to regulatory protein cys-3 [Cephalotrichum gorgonifer]